MPAVAAKTVIPAAPADGAGQAAAMCDAATTLLAASGSSKIAAWSSDGSSNLRLSYWRLAPIDPHYSRADIYCIRRSLTSMYMMPTFDCDLLKVNGPVGPGEGTAVMWAGLWSANYPGLGVPTLSTVSGMAHQVIRTNFGDGTDEFTIRMIASEYGLFYVANNGTAEFWNCHARPTDTIRPGRDIGFTALASGVGPYTFVAPTGAAHLIVESDGRSTSITFPAATPLTGWEIAREITMQGAGFIEATIETESGVPNTELLRLQIPQLRFPSAGIAATGITPRIRLTYQDPQFVLGGWNFSPSALIAINASALSAPGVRGTIQFPVTRLPLAGVHIGSCVYNRTAAGSAFVVAFDSSSLPGNPLDTVILDNLPIGWNAGDDYDLYPFCDQMLGTSVDGGQYQATLWSDPTDPIAAQLPGSGSVQVVLTDLYGEAYGHYVAGQGVFLMNNGLAVLALVEDETGFVLGELVQNTTTGAVGIIRGISGKKFVIDTISHDVNPSSVVPWSATDAVVSYNSVNSPAPVGTGSTNLGPVVSSSSGAWLTEGQSGLVQVTGISRAYLEGGAADDLRTVLSLALDDALLNPGLKLFPSCVVGVRAKVRAMQVGDSGSTDAMPGPSFGISLGSIVGTDERANERGQYSSGEPQHVPDVDSSSFEAAQHLPRWSSARVGDGLLGALAHFRGVNIASAVAPVVSPGDLLYEHLDPARVWVAVSTSSGALGFGAITMQPGVTQRYLIGPADSSLG